MFLISSGSSSQEVACFSEERTKYLMLSKSMPPRSEPQVGMGFLPNSFEALEAHLEHPLGLALLGRDVADDGLVDAALGVGAGDVLVGPAELVRADAEGVDVAVDRGHVSDLPSVVRERDEGGADAVAVGDGGEALDVDVEQAPEGGRLGVAQLRELRGDVLDRAVVLAQLDAGAVRGDRGGVPVVGQRLGERGGAVLGAVEAVAVAVLELGDPRLGERLDRGVAAGGLQEAQRAGGEVVVGARAGGVAGVGEGVAAGGAAAAAQHRPAVLAGRDGAVGDEGVEVAADAGRAHLEPLGEHRGRGRAERQQQRQQSLPGPLGVRHGFHNASVL